MSKRTHPSTTTTTTSKKPRRSSRVARQKYGPCWSGTTSDTNTILVLDTRKNQASHYDAKKSRLKLLQDVWAYKIIPLLHVAELAVLRPTCTWFEQRWQDFLARNLICVPQDVPTIDQAMFFASILSEQKEFTKGGPLVVLLSEGEHVVEGSVIDSDGNTHASSLEIDCENISFVGQGSNNTTVFGQIVVVNKKNVILKNLTLTSPSGYGLAVQKASVEILSVSVHKCSNIGMIFAAGAFVQATQCEFSENTVAGVEMKSGAKGIFTDCTFHHGHCGVVSEQFENVDGQQATLVELRGEKTEIYNNGIGLCAIGDAIISMHIPSRPITAVVHDNETDDLFTHNGSKIQSQLSSSSLELTVIHRDGESV